MKSWTPMELQLTLARQELLECQELNRRYGLVLTQADITELLELRSQALQAAGRVEFGGGILPKLMKTFCSSAYVDQQNYASTLAELQDAFYYFKSESQDLFSDDELLEFMEKVFNGPAEGSAELMSTISLENLCRWARSGGPDRYAEEERWD